MPQKFQTLKKSKKFSKSSQKWLLRQVNDPFVERAKIEGWRSRATFKIIEIDKKFNLFKKNKIVVDLGCAPGGWSQYCVEKVGMGNIVAIDLLEIPPIAGVNFLQLDFLEKDADEKIINELKKIKFNKNGHCDLVLSDMASNTTGDHNTDHLRIIDLLEQSLKLANKILKNNGSFVGKIFQGGSSEGVLKLLRENFTKVKYFKPDSSRKDSSETYLVAQGFKAKNTDNLSPK
ncbi:MAG: RlmE family RNA methyltransferase [Proteobacteria bacterium]|nr:RlmE family RNA methyltransferase [Pseudomonadota bacterium]NCA27966.1 RlmE family RNA methyltransferase [Pseudomonadota bacterium]